MSKPSRERSHIGQVLSVFIWGLLLRIGLSATGAAQPLENQLLSDFALPSYVILGILFVLSILTFLYPLFVGIRGYRLAGLVGILALGIAFVSGYLIPERIEVGIALLAAAVLLWLIGRSRLRARSAKSARKR